MSRITICPKNETDEKREVVRLSKRGRRAHHRRLHEAERKRYVWNRVLKKTFAKQSTGSA